MQLRRAHEVRNSLSRAKPGLKASPRPDERPTSPEHCLTTAVDSPNMLSLRIAPVNDVITCGSVFVAASFMAMRQFGQQNTDTEIVLLPSKRPNLNVETERCFRSLKSECLDLMIFFGRQSLERTVREFIQHSLSRRTQSSGTGP